MAVSDWFRRLPVWCCILVCLTMVGCGDAKPGVRRIIILTNGTGPFWDACRAGIDEANKDFKLADAHLEASMDSNDGKLASQLEKLRQYGTQSDIAGIAISAIQADNATVAEVLHELKKKGVAVITIDSDVDRSKFRDARTAFIGTDNLQGGIELGKAARSLLPEGGDYVTFTANSVAQNGKERIAGFAEGAGDKFKAVDGMLDDFDRPKARENVRNAIVNHPKLTALVGIYSYNAPAIVEVLEETKKQNEVKAVVFDAEPGTIEHMGKGKVDVMVVQNPYQMGYQGVRLLQALATKNTAVEKEMLPNLGKENGDIFDTGLKVVVPNDSTIKKDLFAKKTEFLKYDDFKAWLDKYKLTGS
jgi:ribose transport system substrate-binding protein